MSTCSPAVSALCQKRISGTLLERNHVEVPRVTYDKLSPERQGEPSSAVCRRVTTVQARCFTGKRLRTYAAMGPAEVREYRRLDKAVQRQMQAAMRQLQLLARLPPCAK